MAVPADAPRVEALFLEMLRSIFPDETPEGYAPGDLDRFFTGCEDWICVAEAAGAVVGFLSIEAHREEQAYLYLDDFSVSEACRGQGIGTALLQTAERYAEAIGVSAVLLHVEKRNAAARRLYERQGYHLFRDDGRRLLLVKEVMQADTLELVAPSPAYADQIRDFRDEVLTYDADNSDQFAGCLGLRECEDPEDWIRLCALRESPQTCEQAGTNVPSNTYLAIRRRDGRLVGVIDLRHHIDHPILGEWGGHCGYTVRPSERGQGYAREMLRLDLDKARAQGLKRLLVTCDARNPASEKVILANGGMFERLAAVEGAEIKRFWIEL